MGRPGRFWRIFSPCALSSSAPRPPRRQTPARLPYYGSLAPREADGGLCAPFCPPSVSSPGGMAGRALLRAAQAAFGLVRRSNPRRPPLGPTRCPWRKRHARPGAAHRQRGAALSQLSDQLAADCQPRLPPTSPTSRRCEDTPAPSSIGPSSILLPRRPSPTSPA